MTDETGIIVGVSVSHERADVETIEAACTEEQRETVETLLDRPGVEEAFVLQTCNRAEAYVVAGDEGMGRDALEWYVAGVEESVVEWLGHEESIRHLMCVACGLESLVLGEDQILGQVRDAYEDARDAGGIGATFEDAILKALHVGERAREETAINEGIVSLGSAAVEIAADERSLEGATAVVVGAGEMATLAARALGERVERVLVANRTIPNAERVVEELDADASAVGLGALSTVASEAEVLVSATGSDGYVIDESVLQAAGETFVVDLARPQDVDPAAARAVDDVDVRDLDALEAIAGETRRKREEAAETVEAMIEDEFEHLLTQYKRKRADRVIAAMYESAERMKAQELRQATSKLEAQGELTDTEREVLEAMADSLVNRLLAAPTESLRDAAENDDWTTINTALQLFDPDFQPDGASPSFADGVSDEESMPDALEGLVEE